MLKSQKKIHSFWSLSQSLKEFISFQSLKTPNRVLLLQKPKQFSLFSEPKRGFAFFKASENIEALLREPEIIDLSSEDGPESTYKGKLVVCPTPLGNLKDMTLRQFETLRNSDIIACEDTRNTGKLFKLLYEKEINKALWEMNGIDMNALQATETNSADSPQESNSSLSPEDKNKGISAEKQETERRLREREEERKEEEDLKIENEIFDRAITGMKDKFRHSNVGLENRELMRSLLSKNDTLRHMYTQEKYTKSSYDSHSTWKKKRSRSDDINDFGDSIADGLDDEVVAFLRKRVYESRLKKGRGLLISYHKFNEENRIPKLLIALKAGLTVALVSDAGTPTVSDPGFRLVNECLLEGIRVQSLPGPSAVAVALSGSGFPADQFSFEGYLPRKKHERELRLSAMKSRGVAAVVFENNSRLLKTLLSIEKVYGPKHLIYLAIEMTKLHERALRGTVRSIYEKLDRDEDEEDSGDGKGPLVKGEMTIVVAPNLDLFNEGLKEEMVRMDDSTGEKKPEEKGKENKRELREGEFVMSLEKLTTVLVQEIDAEDQRLAQMIVEMTGVPFNEAKNEVYKQKNSSLKMNKLKQLKEELFKYHR